MTLRKNDTQLSSIKCHYAECRVFYCYAVCRYAQCRYADCRYAGCRGAKFKQVGHSPMPQAIL